jgi:hypothetical protein
MNIIYADSLFGLSVLTDYLLCLVTARFCSLRLRRWRYLAAAVFGGAYAVAVFLPGCAWMAHPLCELCAAGLMGLVAFGGEEKLFRGLAAFLAVSASFGGAAWAVALRQGSMPAPNPPKAKHKQRRATITTLRMSPTKPAVSCIQLRLKPVLVGLPLSWLLSSSARALFSGATGLVVRCFLSLL